MRIARLARIPVLVSLIACTDSDVGTGAGNAQQLSETDADLVANSVSENEHD